jgi:hypothetical protein
LPRPYGMPRALHPRLERSAYRRSVSGLPSTMEEVVKVRATAAHTR